MNTMNTMKTSNDDGKKDIQLVITPPSKQSSPIAPPNAIAASLEGLSSTFSNPSSAPISASSASSSSSSSSAVNDVAKSTFNTHDLDSALQQVDTAIAKEFSTTATILRTVLRLKQQSKDEIEAFPVNPFVRDAALALHNFKVVQCESNDQLQKLALDASRPYMNFIRELESKIAAHKKALETKFKQENEADQKKVNDLISALFANRSKEIDKLKTIFIDDVVKNREALLYFGSNRSFARGAGANNTYYVPAFPHDVKVDILAGKSISEALADSKAIVIQRKLGANKFDGIGAMGGLIETTRRHFPAFNVEKFNAGDAHFKKYLQEQHDDRAKKLTGGKVPEHLVESTKHVIKTAAALLKYMDNKTDALRAEIRSCLDDVEFDEIGNISINTDPRRSALHAAEREGAEESAELQGLGLLLNRLSKSVNKEDKAQLLMGGNDVLVDDNFFLSIRGISQGEDEAQAVSPVILGSACSLGAFGSLEEGLKEGGLGKFVSPMTHGEIAGVEVLSLNDLRRRAGVSVDGKALSEEISLKGDLYGKYAYRYVHEYAGTALKLSIMQLANALKGDEAALKLALIKMAQEDQIAVFHDEDENGKKRNHKINLLSAAKIMFKKDIKECQREHPDAHQDVVDAIAYLKLSMELGVEGVTLDVLQLMDMAAEKVYNERMKK